LSKNSSRAKKNSSEAISVRILDNEHESSNHSQKKQEFVQENHFKDIGLKLKNL